MQSNREQRIFECLNFDKKKNPEGLNELLKSDLLKTLNNYFEVNENNFVIKIDVLDDGTYSLKAVAKADSIKPLNFLR